MCAFQVRSFRDDTQVDAIAVINEYLSGWPYTRPIDLRLVRYWRTLASLQPADFLIAYYDGELRACLHAEVIKHRQRMHLHLLALKPGAIEEAVYLLHQLEARAQSLCLLQLTGPGPASATFYGGHVLGSEPYHPHWAVEGTQAYIRAGYHISQAEVLMVRDLSKEVVVDVTPAEYGLVEAADCKEHGARAFGYLALHENVEVAHCYARLYPDLESPTGGSVGQIGDVGTVATHRNRGLARVMTQMCLRTLQTWGASEALISTGLDNAPALRAYERAGFERRHFTCEWSKVINEESWKRMPGIRGVVA